MKIETFIFLDLETTGLMNGRIMPKITEIAMIAVTRGSVSTSNYDSVPRVMHKLVLPINPERVIPPVVEHLTKLSNEDMRILKPIRCEVYELIIHFINRFTPPICFVAHNGKYFDYPIFLWELQCMNKILEDKILCIDTRTMFQDFFIKRDLDLSLSRDSIMLQKILEDEFNESLSSLDMTEVNSVEAEFRFPSTSCSLPHDHGYSKVIKPNNNKRDRNEDVEIVETQSLKNPKLEDVEKTPENQMIREKDVVVERPKKINIPRKRLDFGYERPENLKLEAIYRSMFRSNLESHHSAEADCLAMLRCATKIADFFLEWSDQHAIPLISCARKI